MNAGDKYANIFGRIETLAEPMSWTTGVSSMLEWLTWGTGNVPGVTKTRFRQMIVEWSHDEEIRFGNLEDKQAYVQSRLQAEITSSERENRYDKPNTAIATPREALRRAKFFSEDYLNKEFDIFWCLSSDRFLDSFYRQFSAIDGGSTWFTHGNGGIFGTSTNIKATQMDNLSYNPAERILVANELKLGGRKNPDQILKYSLLMELLKQREFIEQDARLLLLFIGDKAEDGDWRQLIDEEIAHCSASVKASARSLIRPEIIEIARHAEYASTTWTDLMAFNNRYLSEIDPVAQQVEVKLIQGFNQSLAEKAFMQPN